MCSMSILTKFKHLYMHALSAGHSSCPIDKPCLKIDISEAKT